GTRLVQVQVTVRTPPPWPPGVRAKLAYLFDSGPPFGSAGAPRRGLTQDDFTVLDEGQPRKIAVFSTDASSLSKSQSLPMPQGAVSNRASGAGQALHGSTAVLVDLLNTPFIYTDYARMGLREFLPSLAEAGDPIALYSLGVDLHVLHDFGDDPQKLKDA